MSRWDHVISFLVSKTKYAFKFQSVFWVNYITSHSVSYSFYFQLQSVCQTVESHCAKSERCFNKSWCLVFWLILCQCFTDMSAVMNSVDWNWVRVLMNKINWHWAAHCENNIIGLDYKARNDLTEWKLLNAQHYNTD